jgi:GNAT superfamily N-acetyltransferase
MRWRMTSTEYRRSTKAQRTAALENGVRAGKPTGVLAYIDDRPVGWCSIAPRHNYEGLERYRALPRLDEEPTWAVVCFFVDSQYRRLGMTQGLLKAAVTYAGSQGVRIVEGYPVDSGARSYTYMGSPATFRSAGFQDVTPAGQKRLIFRYYFD